MKVEIDLPAYVYEELRQQAKDMERSWREAGNEDVEITVADLVVNMIVHGDE